MKTKIVHCKINEFDIYIGRGSQWGNPFTHKSGTQANWVVKTREEAIEKYVEWLHKQDKLLIDLPLLKGKTLGCWCAGKQILTCDDKPYICHGQVLAELADSIPEI